MAGNDLFEVLVEGANRVGGAVGGFFTAVGNGALTGLGTLKDMVVGGGNDNVHYASSTQDTSYVKTSTPSPVVENTTPVQSLPEVVLAQINQAVDGIRNYAQQAENVVTTNFSPTVGIPQAALAQGGGRSIGGANA